MNEVVADPSVRLWADTPDKAVVWGLALGLHREVADILRRGLEDPTAAAAGPQPAYYPIWLGTGGPGSSGIGAPGSAGGSLFSGSGIPDIGGMFSALGSVGSSPPLQLELERRELRRGWRRRRGRRQLRLLTAAERTFALL